MVLGMWVSVQDKNDNFKSSFLNCNSFFFQQQFDILI
jgi:hypothetical protein